jgi:hypothetical protein
VFDDRSQLLQRGLRSTLRSGVGKYQHHAVDLPVGVDDRRGAILDGKLAAVAGD